MVDRLGAGRRPKHLVGTKRRRRPGRRENWPLSFNVGVQG